MKKYLNTIFVLLVAFAAVKCENCVTNNFGNNFYNTFNYGNSVCNGMAQWSLGTYSNLRLDAIHQDSEFYITPAESLSCVSSYTFDMKSTGVLEAYVYMETSSFGDQIVVLANELTDGDKTVVTGTAMLTPLSTNYKNGWHVLKINLFGTSEFSGYVTFLGVASPGSKVIIDSFRYIPPLFEDDCHIYDGEIIPPSKDETGTGDCVTYDFEADFDTLFNSDRGFCTGLITWSINNYDNVPIENPSADSQLFIKPGVGLSCISSFTFEVDPDGYLEVNVYMTATADTDQIAILVNQIIDEGNDAVTGSVVISPLHKDYVNGWHTVQIPLSGSGKYEGYVSFIGMAEEDSIVLIDSFRYVPPETSSLTCKIYESDDFITEPTTPAPIGTGQECITYDFEADFDKNFDTGNQLCNGYSSWHLGTYYSLSVESIDPESFTYISPNSSSSCVSSFTFKMMPGGVVEVNVFMSSVSEFDYVIVLAKKVVPGGTDTVAGFNLYYATNENYVEGWNTLKVTVMDFTTFAGYITLIGSTADKSIVLIDSFRYIPPYSEENCDIY